MAHDPRRRGPSLTGDMLHVSEADLRASHRPRRPDNTSGLKNILIGIGVVAALGVAAAFIFANSGAPEAIEGKPVEASVPKTDTTAAAAPDPVKKAVAPVPAIPKKRTTKPTPAQPEPAKRTVTLPEGDAHLAKAADTPKAGLPKGDAVATKPKAKPKKKSRKRKKKAAPVDTTGLDSAMNRLLESSGD